MIYARGFLLCMLFSCQSCHWDLFCCFESLFSVLSLLISNLSVVFSSISSVAYFSLSSLLSPNTSFSSWTAFSAVHLSIIPALSGINLLRWIWSLCANTASKDSQTIWDVGWPSVNVTQKRRRRNRWYPCVFDTLLLSVLLAAVPPLVSFDLPSVFCFSRHI